MCHLYLASANLGSRPRSKHLGAVRSFIVSRPGGQKSRFVGGGLLPRAAAATRPASLRLPLLCWPPLPLLGFRRRLCSPCPTCTRRSPCVHAPVGSPPACTLPSAAPPPGGVPPRARARRQLLPLEGQRCHLIQKDLLLLVAAAKTPFRVGSHLQWGLGFDVTPGGRDLGHRQGRWRLPGLGPRLVGRVT